MPTADSVLDHEQIARCRRLLSPPKRTQSIWAPLGAAAFLAVSALVFAVAMIVAPPVATEHVAPQRGVE